MTARRKRKQETCTCNAYPFPHRYNSNWRRLCSDVAREQADDGGPDYGVSDRDFLDFDRVNRGGRYG